MIRREFSMLLRIVDALRWRRCLRRRRVPRVIAGASHIADIQFTPDGKNLIYSEQTGARPTSLFRASSGGGAAVPIENLNDESASRISN